MDKKVAATIIFITLFLMGGGIFIISSSQTPSFTGLDDFAKCLTEKGAVMYGAYWCPHCQNTKKTFGDSFKFVKYVECTTQSKLCQEKNVAGYPTWIFSDNIRLEGEKSLSDLSQATGCQLPPTQ